MKKALLLLVLALLYTPLFLGAETFVDYLEGYLEVQNGGSWDEVYIGDELSDNAKLKLSDDGYAELMIGDTMVTLTRDGTYEIANLIKGSSSLASTGLDLKKKLTLNTNNEKWQHEATMGIRGAEATTSDSTGMEDAFTYLEAGLEYMADGEFEDALVNLEEGWEFFEDHNCLLFAALSYEELGQKRSYVRSLQDVELDYLEPEYQGIYAARMGDLLIRSLDYNAALSILGSADLKSMNKDEQQQIHFLLGTAYLGSGNNAKAKASFQKAESMAPSSEVGRQAASALSSL